MHLPHQPRGVGIQPTEVRSSGLAAADDCRIHAVLLEALSDCDLSGASATRSSGCDWSADVTAGRDGGG